MVRTEDRQKVNNQTRHTIRTAEYARDRDGGGDTKGGVDKERVRTAKGT